MPSIYYFLLISRCFKYNYLNKGSCVEFWNSEKNLEPYYVSAVRLSYNRVCQSLVPIVDIEPSYSKHSTNKYTFHKYVFQ